MAEPSKSAVEANVVRTMSRAGRYGSEMEVRKSKTRAQTRNTIPGIQKARLILKLGE